MLPSMQNKSKYWVREVQENGPKGTLLFLGATKMDLFSREWEEQRHRITFHSRYVSTRDEAAESIGTSIAHMQEVEEFMKQRDVRGWVPISAENHLNTHRLFVLICEPILFIPSPFSSDHSCHILVRELIKGSQPNAQVPLSLGKCPFFSRLRATKHSTKTIHLLF